MHGACLIIRNVQCRRYIRSFNTSERRSAIASDDRRSRMIFRGFRKFFEVFGLARTCWDLFGCVWMRLDASGCVRMHLDAFGHFWKILENSVENLVFRLSDCHIPSLTTHLRS